MAFSDYNGKKDGVKATIIFFFFLIDLNLNLNFCSLCILYFNVIKFLYILLVQLKYL